MIEEIKEDVIALAGLESFMINSVKRFQSFLNHDRDNYYTVISIQRNSTDTVSVRYLYHKGF